MFKFNIQSETKEIDGVYQFKINFPSFEGLRFVSMYLFQIDDKYVLIDAGLSFTDCERSFLTELEKLNISPSNLQYLIITHEHPDHIGLANVLKEKNPKIKIVMHTITRDIMKYMTNSRNAIQIQESATDASLYLTKYGVGKKLSARVLQYMTNFRSITEFHEPDQVLEDNDEIIVNSNNLKVIWTPGHSVGHICIFDQKKRYLFSGDHILSRITPHIGAFLPNPSIDKTDTFTNILDLYLKSLDKIDKLNPKIIFPAHQEIIYNPHERILEIKKHHANRLIEIAKAIEDTPKTPFKISQIHFGENLSEINTFLALSEVLSHLIYLEQQNKVKRIEKKGLIYFLKT
ncbi:MAG: MBL fold metallo-hydrolase [Candidatus Thorarchaeota archaeon]